MKPRETGVLDMEGPIDSVASRLRSDTAEIHARVEHGMDLLGRMSRVEGYVETLLRMEAFYRALEPRLIAVLEDRINPIFLSSRLPRLRSDLDEATENWHPRSEPFLPESVGTWPFALGALYVLEGAALGGQIIDRRLREHLGVSSAFFGNEGSHVGKRWKSFRGQLDLHPDEYSEIYQGAVACFEAFEAAVVPREVSLG